MRKAKINSVLALLLLLVFVGCANLKAVRDYAGESARLSSYTDLTTRFRDTYGREEPYLFGEASLEAQANDKRRKAAYGDLLKIHQSITLYMQTLAMLAGEDAFDLSKNIDSLAGGIKSYPDFGIENRHVDAVSNITKVITKWITASYQQRAVETMVEEGDTDLQTALDGMKALVRFYRKTNENERKAVLGLFDVEIPYLEASKDKLLTAIARAHLQSKKTEYANAENKYIEAEKGITFVSEGHTKILKNIDKLSKDEIKDLISKISKDIKTIRENLKTIQN